MPNRSESQRVVKRIELVLGKAQVGDVNYYLVKEYNESLYNSKWMTTFEAIPKGMARIKIFNILRANNLKHSSFYIDNKALLKNLAKEYVGSIS